MHNNATNVNLRMPELDGLRGFAALIVILSHTSNQSMYFLPYFDFRGIGKSGVYLFFVLSAFLLFMPFMSKGSNILSKSVMSQYWSRRFLRIYPLYFIYLLLALITTYYNKVMLGKEWGGIPFTLDVTGFIRHLFLQEGLGVTWSIAVEFKFYFVLPILAYITYLIKDKFNSSVALIFIFSLVGITQLLSPQIESIPNSSNLLPYLSIFLLGIIAALFQADLNKKDKGKMIFMVIKILGNLSFLGVLVMTPLVFSLAYEEVPSNYFHKQFVWYATFWSLILLSIINVDSYLKRLFMSKFFRFIGALSFSIYLFHPIVITIVKPMGLGSYLSAWTVLIVSIALSYISFQLIEKPLSKS